MIAISIVGWILLLLGIGIVLTELFSYSVLYLARQSNQRHNLRDLHRRIGEIHSQNRAQTQAIPANDSMESTRTFILTRKIKESDEIYSFYFQPVDGMPLTPYWPGQYVVIAANISDHEQIISRPYSLSDYPVPLTFYKITVKKEQPPKDQPSLPPGIMSSYLVDRIQEGEKVQIGKPMGNFCLDPKGNHPIVMLASGVGITPFLSMLTAMINLQNHREIWLFYGTYDNHSQIMMDYFLDIQNRYPNLHIHICYSNPNEHFRQTIRTITDSSPLTFHLDRINIGLIKKYLPSAGYEFFICGSETMMTKMRENLENWGVQSSQIHTEKFRFNIGASWNCKAPVVIPHDATIEFSRSRKKTNWHNSESTVSILSLAEFNEVHIPCSCRSGECGNCRTKIKSGKVQHMTDCEKLLNGDDYCLPCVAIPASKELVLDI